MNTTDYLDDVIEEIDSEIEDAESSVPVYKISSYPTDQTLEGLHLRWQRGEIEIPGFQRGWVWKHIQASRLVESFLLGLPVPEIFLYRDGSSRHLFVIDGQQRLRTIFGFFDGKLPDVKDFYLRGVDPRWEHKRYKDLKEVDRIQFRDAMLRAMVIEQTDPKDNSSIYHIFERLNTGGTHLNPQEVRNSLAHGPFNELMLELNELDKWREIFGKKDPDLRMRDVELVVRFCALRDTSVPYSSPMKEFLHAYMKRNQWEIAHAPTRETFESTVSRVLDTLGPKPFHIRRGINVAIYDSTMLAFSRAEEIPKDIDERWEKLLKNPDFDQATKSGTTAVRTVANRIEIASKTLFN